MEAQMKMKRTRRESAFTLKHEWPGTPHECVVLSVNGFAVLSVLPNGRFYRPGAIHEGTGLKLNRYAQITEQD